MLIYICKGLSLENKRPFFDGVCKYIDSTAPDTTGKDQLDFVDLVKYLQFIYKQDTKEMMRSEAIQDLKLANEKINVDPASFGKRIWLISNLLVLGDVELQDEQAELQFYFPDQGDVEAASVVAAFFALLPLTSALCTIFVRLLCQNCADFLFVFLVLNCSAHFLSLPTIGLSGQGNYKPIRAEASTKGIQKAYGDEGKAA